MLVQTVAAAMASLVLRLMFGGEHLRASVTVHADGGSNIQSLVLEFFITFYLMFVIMAVATDDRAVIYSIIAKPSPFSHATHKLIRTDDGRLCCAGRADGWARGGRNHHPQRAVCRVRMSLLAYCSHQLIS
jgi:glycerol uptake facilitator-like aquaporin